MLNKAHKSTKRLTSGMYGHLSLWAHSLRTVLMAVFILLMTYMLVRSKENSVGIAQESFISKLYHNTPIQAQVVDISSCLLCKCGVGFYRMHACVFCDFLTFIRDSRPWMERSGAPCSGYKLCSWIAICYAVHSSFVSNSSLYVGFLHLVLVLVDNGISDFAFLSLGCA